MRLAGMISLAIQDRSELCVEELLPECTVGDRACWIGPEHRQGQHYPALPHGHQVISKIYQEANSRMRAPRTIGEEPVDIPKIVLLHACRRLDVKQGQFPANSGSHHIDLPVFHSPVVKTPWLPGEWKSLFQFGHKVAFKDLAE